MTLNVNAILIYKLQTVDSKRKRSDTPILSEHGKHYGSGYYTEGKSKFHNGDISSEMPDEEREGQSRFYRQEAVDSKTPDKDGFSDIFNGE